MASRELCRGRTKEGAKVKGKAPCGKRQLLDIYITWLNGGLRFCDWMKPYYSIHLSSKSLVTSNGCVSVGWH